MGGIATSDGAPGVAWRKSSYSGGNGGNCVEVGRLARAILVRDSADRHGPLLAIPADAWRRFTGAAHRS